MDGNTKIVVIFGIMKNSTKKQDMFKKYAVEKIEHRQHLLFH